MTSIWTSRTCPCPRQARALPATSPRPPRDSRQQTTGRATRRSRPTTSRRGPSTRAWPCCSASWVSSTSRPSSPTPSRSLEARTASPRGLCPRPLCAWRSRERAWRRGAEAASPPLASPSLVSLSACALATRPPRAASSAKRWSTSGTCCRQWPSLSLTARRAWPNSRSSSRSPGNTRPRSGSSSRARRALSPRGRPSSLPTSRTASSSLRTPCCPSAQP
mmetsp:Transcript_22766/g.71292  ORF Transcript_22766/g.71292 Transcript_22766/m.71292 type:complete len:220 (+) Transcript_22766:2862-3521(+)